MWFYLVCWFSNCGPWISSIGIIQEFVRTADFWPHPTPTKLETLKGELAIWILTNPPHQSKRSADLEPCSSVSMLFTTEPVNSHIQTCPYLWLWDQAWQIEGFPDSSVGKESACNAGDPGLIPGSGRSTREGIGYQLQYSWASLVAQLVKNSPAMQETWFRFLGWEDPLEKGKATHSSILTWRIPWTIVHGISKSRTLLSNFHSSIYMTNRLYLMCFQLIDSGCLEILYEGFWRYFLGPEWKSATVDYWCLPCVQE